MPAVARVTDKVFCPRCKLMTEIVSGSSSSTADDLAIARVGDKTSCGATIIKGSSMATADERPVAYVGCMTSHGGTIITGSPTSDVMA